VARAYRGFPGPRHSERVKELTHGLLAGFRDHLDRPLATPSILARTEEGATGRLPTRATRLALQRAIDLAVLDGNGLTLPGADAIRADARRFQELVGSEAVVARAAALFAQGLQTRGPLELDLGDRIGSL
jgi:hypothetical protein